jgi:hypothetical protein
MTIVGTNRGPVSGNIYFRLLRESAAERAARAAASRQVETGRPDSNPSKAERSGAKANPRRRAD